MIGLVYDSVVSLRSVSLSVIKLFRSFSVIFIFQSMVDFGHCHFRSLSFLQSMFDFRPKTPEPARPERAESPSPGQRPGLLWMQACRPERAKAFKS